MFFRVFVCFLCAPTKFAIEKFWYVCVHNCLRKCHIFAIFAYNGTGHFCKAGSKIHAFSSFFTHFILISKVSYFLATLSWYVFGTSLFLCVFAIFACFRANLLGHFLGSFGPRTSKNLQKTPKK